MYAISVLRSHGMCVPLLQQVFQSVVISKLTYAAPAWWGFSTSADRQHVETFLRRAARSGLWKYGTTAEELVDDADEQLFSKVRYCAHHVLNELLPLTSDSQHNPRKRRHNITLPEKKGHLAAKNFIIRLLYKDTYWLQYWFSHNLTFSLFQFFTTLFSIAFCQLSFHSKDWIGLDWILPSVGWWNECHLSGWVTMNGDDGCSFWAYGSGWLNSCTFHESFRHQTVAQKLMCETDRVVPDLTI